MRAAWFGMATIVALGVIALGMAAPAAADTKAGVDAWQRGDYRKAVEEWRQPAAGGDADAQFNLGQAYKLGRGVPVDLGMAEEWYRKAAQQGHPQAEDNYGLALFQNNRRDQALPWLEKSTARGEPRAQYVLGTMYFNGDSVKRDWVRAYALMLRASAAGLPQASSTLAQMDRYVGLQDRQQGTVLARQIEADSARPQFPADGVASRPSGSPLPGQGMMGVPLPPSRADQSPVSAAPPPPKRGPRPAPIAVERLPAERLPAERLPVERAPAPIAGGAWKLQLGAFGDPANARRLGAQVGSRFPGRSVSYVKAGALTRVIVGGFASSADASRACGGLKPCAPVHN